MFSVTVGTDNSTFLYLFADFLLTISVTDKPTNRSSFLPEVMEIEATRVVFIAIVAPLSGFYTTHPLA